MINNPVSDEILDAALRLADTKSWEAVHLFDIATNLNITLEQIRAYYPQKDDLVEAWFNRADRAVLSIDPSEDFLKRSDSERLHTVMMTWLNALTSYHKVTREMLYYKLEFGHIHLQVLGVLRISRTVQWFREAARINTTHLRRVVEEIGTTSIYLITFSRWLFDDSQGSENTRLLLEKLLTKAENCAGVCDSLVPQFINNR